MSAAPVNWFEAAGPDASALVSFYGELFEWSPADPTGHGYHVVTPEAVDATDDERPAGITGGIWDAGAEVGSFAVFYVQVDDLDKAVRRAEELGGSVIVSARENGPVRFAHVGDPAGNRVGIYQPLG